MAVVAIKLGFVTEQLNLVLQFDAANRRTFIRGAVNEAALDVWDERLGELQMPAHQVRSIWAFMDRMRILNVARDSLDSLRDEMPVREGGDHQRKLPTRRQRAELFARTATFFDATYATLSALSGVLARFVDTFGRSNELTNARFLSWLEARYPEVGHGVSLSLEPARMFRALLEHPQQFPAQAWASSSHTE